MFASIIRLLAVAVPVLVQGQLNTSPYLIQQQEQEQRQQQQPGMSYNPVQEKKQQQQEQHHEQQEQEQHHEEEEEEQQHQHQHRERQRQPDEEEEEEEEVRRHRQRQQEEQQYQQQQALRTKALERRWNDTLWLNELHLGSAVSMASSSILQSALDALKSEACDATSMDRNAVFELAQMTHAWEGAGKHHYHSFSEASTSAASAQNYQVSFLGPQGDGCLRWEINENPSLPVKGGTSFLAETHSKINPRICSVANYLNGSYVVSCARPPPGTCASILVEAQWTNYEAYRNSVNEGITDGNPRGGFRHGSKAQVVRHHYCEPSPSTKGGSLLSDLIAAPTTTQKAKVQGWINASFLELRALWQDHYVWRFENGALQAASVHQENRYKRCFGRVVAATRRSLSSTHPHDSADYEPLKAVYFMGSSQMDYMAEACLMREILGVEFNRKTVSGLGPDDAINSPGGGAFWEFRHVKNKTLAKYVQACGADPSNCAQPIKKGIMSCFFGKGSVTRSCNWRITTLGSAASLLNLIYLNLPPSVTEESPWTEDHVVVVMASDWDAMLQRDARETAITELSHFMRVVEEIRNDPRTVRMRIVLDFGPAFPKTSKLTTGWRSNHAFAAEHAYAKRVLGSRPELAIEFVTPNYFEMTLPRTFDAVDDIHFARGGLGQKDSKENVAGGKDKVLMERLKCQGDVGKAFLRVLLDHICTRPRAAELSGGSR